MLKTLLSIITTINLFLFLFIIYKVSRKWKVNKAHRRFILLILFGFLWLVAVYIMPVVSSLKWHIFLVKFDFSLAPLIAGLFITFIIHFPNNNEKFNSIKELLTLSPLMVLFFLSYTNIFLYIPRPRVYETTNAYFVYLGLIGIYFLIIGAYIAIKKIKLLSGIERQQLLYLVIGYGLAIFVNFIDSADTNIFGTRSILYERYVLNASFLFSVVAVYAMLRYRFLDIRVIVRRSIIYGISLVVALVFYTYLALLIRDSIEKSWQLSPGWTAAILIALVALGFPVLKSLVEKAINSLFKGQKSIDLAVKEVREKISQRTELDNLIEIICSEVKKFLDVSWVKLYILDRKFQNYQFKEDGDVSIIERKNDLIHYYEKYSEPLVREEIPHLIEERPGEFEREMLRKADKEMKKKKTTLAVPFRTEDGIFAILLIGDRQDKRPYTIEDVKYLEAIREQVGFTLANALLYKEAMERITVGNN